MHYFKYENREYCVDEEVPSCLKIDKEFKAALDVWESSGRNISAERLREALYEEGIQKSTADEVADDILEYRKLISVTSDESNIDFSLHSIELHIAHGCNLGCKYCFASKGDYGTSWRLMDSDTASRAIDMLVAQAPQEKTLGIVFFGGEPLLNVPIIKHVMQYVRDIYPNRKFTYSVTTNGTLLDDAFIELAARDGFHTLISMDDGQAMQDTLRPFKNGKGSSFIIKQNISKYMDAVSFGVRATITKKNTNLKEMCREFESIGFNRAYFAPVSSTDESIALDEMALYVLDKELDSLANEAVDAAGRGKRAFYQGFSDQILRIMNGSRLVYGCGAGRRFVAVSPEGYLYPCHRFVGMDSFCLGNIWESEALPTQEKFWNATVESRGDCKSCWLRSYCGGGCCWEAANDDGTITIARDKTLCMFRQKLFEHAVDICWRLQDSTNKQCGDDDVPSGAC